MDVGMTAVGTHGWWSELDQDDLDYNLMMLIGTYGFFSQTLVVDIGTKNHVLAMSSIKTQINLISRLGEEDVVSLLTTI